MKPDIRPEQPDDQHADHFEEPHLEIIYYQRQAEKGMDKLGSEYNGDITTVLEPIFLKRRAVKAELLGLTSFLSTAP